MKKFLTFTGLLFLPAWQCAASVAIDAVGPGSSGTSASGSSSLSWTHTVTSSGANLALVVGVGVGASVDTGISLSASFNAMPMTSLGIVHAGNSNAGFVQLFCLAAPAAGAHTVAVSASGGSADLVGGSISFTGVSQTTPCRNAATAYSYATTVSVTVSSAAGDMVVDAVGAGSAISGSNQSLAWMRNLNGNTGDGNVAQSTASGASSVTMGYSGIYDFYGIIGVDLAAATSGITPNGSGVITGSFSPCDINQDGVVNSADVSAAVNLVLNPPGTCTTTINGAGSCNVAVVQRVISATLAGGTCHPVSLSWSPSSSQNIIGYNIYRTTTPGSGYVKLNSSLISTTTFVDASSQPGVTYYYAATAVDVSGNESAYSTPSISATIPTP